MNGAALQLGTHLSAVSLYKNTEFYPSNLFWEVFFCLFFFNTATLLHIIDIFIYYFILVAAIKFGIPSSKISS